MVFAEPSDLSTLVGVTIPDDRAALFIAQAAATITGWTGQLIEQVENDEITADLIGSQVFLPQIPVTDVASVLYRAADGTWQPLTADTDYSWSESGVIHLYTGRPIFDNWRGPGDVRRGCIQVTYTHGYATVPDSIKAVTLSIAARAMANPLNLQARTVNGVTEQYQREVHGVSNLLDSEEAVLGRFTVSVVA